MAKTKKDNDSQKIHYHIYKLDYTFETFKSEAKLIEVNDEFIKEYFSFPTDSFFDEITISHLKKSFELIKEETRTNQSFNDYLYYVSSPMVSTKLYGFVEHLFGERKINNSVFIGTTCLALLRFRYWWEAYLNIGFSAETKRKNKINIDFFELLQKYQAGNIEIEEIKIKVKSPFKTKNYFMPINLFDNFYDNYMAEVKRAGINPETYLTGLKTQSLNWVKNNPTEKTQLNSLIRKYAHGFNQMFLNEFKISKAYHRHQIIGHLFSEIGVLPTIETIKRNKLAKGYSNIEEYLADRIREFLRQNSKK